MEQILNILRSLPKMMLELMIHELIKEEKISFSDITNMHIAYLEKLKDGALDRQIELENHIYHIWASSKKNMPDKAAEAMHYLLDKGRLNMTHEQIDNKHKRKSNS